MLKQLLALFSLSLTATAAVAQTDGPAPLKRGLMAIHCTSNTPTGGTAVGNLVSWRAFKKDGRNYKFKLWKGNGKAQTTTVNSGNYIIGKTNFLDANGISGAVYRLEVYDENNQLVETEISGGAWENQVKYIDLEGGAPADPTSAKATYTPNDASYCDMDGDGEYEIILKWVPNNEKDAANSGTTSPAFYSCYKLSGKRMWMLHTGHNMFNSAHSSQFIAWDMDGDGYGEFMVKTAPGAIDGNGKNILLGNDSPTANLKGSKGKQDKGSEYLTIFDGRTGAELKTIYYHTKYSDESTSFWGDSNMNRSERYLAAIAWLDGEDKNPSAIFARGYYAGCKIGAYDWDGTNLTLRWLHRGASATSGTVTYADGTKKNLTSSAYGDGAHWISVADVNGDGKQEIVYGSSTLKPDGTMLYRTGLGHGDALHVGDFIPSRPGLEVFMSLEGSTGVNLHDGTTGQILVRHKADGDTGRGIMAHFNPEAEDAYFQHTSSASLYDTNNKVILSSVSHGGGGLPNNNIFWDGDLGEEHYDKSVLENYSGGFNRIQVNGGNYTIGTLNNGSKNNPCVLGDLMGDWREEIVNWAPGGSTGYQLVINATNYQTDYTFPHLMDNYAYRAQLINQNCCYNQPPHVSYDPRTEKTITTTLTEIEPLTEAGEKQGKYWGTFYTTYPVIIPNGVTVWNIGNKKNTDFTVDVTKYNGKYLPANSGVLLNSDSPEVTFIPTTQSQSEKPSTYMKGYYCDSTLTSTNTYGYYVLRNGDRGLGFYKADGVPVQHNTGFMAYLLANAESYVLPASINPTFDITTGIHELEQAPDNNDNDIWYTIQGTRVTSNARKGILINKGKKIYR